MNDPKRTGWHAVIHPNSLEGRAAHDKALRKAINAGRTDDDYRRKGMEHWAMAGFRSIPRGALRQEGW